MISTSYGTNESLDAIFSEFATIFKTGHDLFDALQLAANHSTGEERSTWLLLLKLLSHRLIPAESVTATQYSSHNAVIASHDSTLGELFLIKEWLQETCPEITPVKAKKGYLLATTKALRNLIDKGSVVEQIDPDAEIRLKASLAQEDVNFDHALHKSIFNHVRRGDITAAAELCFQSDQAWRAAILLGSVPASDPLLDQNDSQLPTFGNQNRLMLKSICANIAASATDVYERALYAHLAGDGLGVCFI